MIIARHRVRIKENHVNKTKIIYSKLKFCEDLIILTMLTISLISQSPTQVETTT